MKNEGLLKAAIETMTATADDMRKDREADRRTITAMMHQLDDAVNRLWELSAQVAEQRAALSMQSTGGMLKTPRMAKRIDMHPATLRRMASAGTVPGHQSVELGDWLFDPDEVIQAIKSRKPDPHFDPDAAWDQSKAFAEYDQIEREGEPK